MHQHPVLEKREDDRAYAGIRRIYLAELWKSACSANYPVCATSLSDGVEEGFRIICSCGREGMEVRRVFSGLSLLTLNIFLKRMGVLTFLIFILNSIWYLAKTSFTPSGWVAARWDHESTIAFYSQCEMYSSIDDYFLITNMDCYCYAIIHF